MTSIGRDDNHVPIQGLNSLVEKKAVTYTATGEGSVAAHTMYTVTGDVIVSVFGVCNTNLDSGGVATIELGIAGNTAALIAQTTATDIDDGEVWIDNAPATVEALPSNYILNDGTDIIATVGTATITAGQIDFYCFWRPLEAGATVVAA